jgi:ribonuclease HI
MAIIVVLKKIGQSNDEITIYSDSKNTISQLNHQFAINSEQLRDLAREAWSHMNKLPNLKLVWIPRAENLAGKMLGS